MTKQVNTKQVILNMMDGTIPFDLKQAKQISVPFEHGKAWSNFIKLMSHPLSDVPKKDLNKKQSIELDSLCDHGASVRLLAWAMS